MREFNTAVKEATETPEEAAVMPFTVDGKEYLAYKPEPAQLAVLVATTGRHSSETDKIAGIINFFVEVLDDRSQADLIHRLLDRKDSFGIDEVTEIMSWMIEEWTGRPTALPSGSTPSP